MSRAASKHGEHSAEGAARRKVLLLYPSSDADRMSVLPLSLLYVAQPLLEQGFEVKVLDQRYDREFFASLSRELGEEPICVGISCITGPQIEKVKAVCEFIRERVKTPIVLGGPHATLLPEQTLTSELFDYVVTGKGESPFLHLVQALESKSSVRSIGQVGSKEDGRAYINREPMPEIPVRKVPYHLVREYGRQPVIPVITSFGCPYRCTFCVEKVFHPEYKEVPFDDVLFMLAEACELRPDLINFLDDNFLANPKKVMKLLFECREKKMEFNWICTGRIDEVLKMGYDALRFAKSRGLTGIFFGVESGSETILKLINKRLTPGMVLEVNRMLKSVGIMAHYSFMAGFPTETGEDVALTIKLMKLLKHDNPGAVIWKLNKYTPYPGTEMYDLAVRNGFKPPDSFNDWAHVHFYSEQYNLPYDIHY